MIYATSPHTLATAGVTRSATAISRRWNGAACNWHKSQDYAGHTPTIRRIAVRWREGTLSSIASSRTGRCLSFASCTPRCCPSCICQGNRTTKPTKMNSPPWAPRRFARGYSDRGGATRGGGFGTQSLVARAGNSTFPPSKLTDLWMRGCHSRRRSSLGDEETGFCALRGFHLSRYRRHHFPLCDRPDNEPSCHRNKPRRRCRTAGSSCSAPRLSSGSSASRCATSATHSFPDRPAQLTCPASRWPATRPLV
jgi:hypothetical protein